MLLIEYTMSNNQFSHVSPEGKPQMVDVSDKPITRRTAKAAATVEVGDEILRLLRSGELVTAKGPVFQTAIVAGVSGAKQTASLIPFCHALQLEDCQINIYERAGKIQVESTVVTTGKTGAEMEAITAVSIASLTIYDMCKAISHHITITDIRLIEKSGGKRDFKQSAS